MLDVSFKTIVAMFLLISKCKCEKRYSISHVQLFVILWIVACQAPLSIEFCRQEYWSGLPFPPPGDLPDPGIEPASPALAGGFFPTEVAWEGG